MRDTIQTSQTMCATSEWHSKFSECFMTVFLYYKNGKRNMREIESVGIWLFDIQSTTSNTYADETMQIGKVLKMGEKSKPE